MEENRTNRRLAAILAADVVGYSRMMASDEAGTLAALKRHRETVFDPSIARHNGRVVKLIGDGTLAEFTSVVDAVNCALAVQRAAESGITLRIGVNLGDVIIDGDDIYGDGVNVAARLEPLAEPGGICIASIVNESVGNRVDAAFEDAGEVQVKNIDRPIRVWKWAPGNAAKTPAPTPPASSAVATGDLPSIAVLPFANMSGDPEQEYFSDGISEDIITDLSKIGGLLVIARNSTFAYKGRHVDVRAIGKDLRVRSVLEGSIRRVGNRVRITAQLIDAETGGHLWAERYDRDLTDIFAVQDEVTRQIVGALKVKLTPGEAALLVSAGTADITAHDLVLRGGALLRGTTQTAEVYGKVTAVFREAIARDPNYAEAYALLAVAHVLDYQSRWSGDPEGSLNEARSLAEIAISKGPNEPIAHHAAALVARFDKNFARWSAEVETTLSLSPNFALGNSARGEIKIFSGDPMGGIPHIERAARLDPAFSQMFMHFLALAYLIAGKYETAAALFRDRLLLAPQSDVSRAFLAATLGHLGEVDQARAVWRDLEAINPEYSFDEHMRRLPFRDQTAVERIRQGLTKAGLPPQARISAL